MAKYYIKTGTLEVIFSTELDEYAACCRVIHECTPDDEVDEYMYVDQRGYRDYASAQSDTIVIETERVLREEGYIK